MSRSAASRNPVGQMFGRIAGVYDFLNHFLSFGIDRRWRKELAAEVRLGHTGVVLDLAAGTLDVALTILRQYPRAIIPAIDFCPPMLVRGRQKLNGDAKKNHIFPCAGDALRLPLRDNCADSLTMAFGIRNIQPRTDAFREMFRALAPGGKACILEFGSGQERIWGGIYNFYLSCILPGIGKLVARDDAAYAYLARTIREFPTAAVLASEMAAAGFVNVGWRKLTSGIVCLHWGFKPDKQAV